MENTTTAAPAATSAIAILAALPRKPRKKVPFDVTEPDGTTRRIWPIGRDAWALENLLAAGPAGITSLENPAPRLSGYIHKLRTVYGLHIETRYEEHGGQFHGSHGRYVLHSKVARVAGGEA